MKRTERFFETTVIVIIMIVSVIMLVSAYTTKSYISTDGMASMDFPKVVLWMIMGLCTIVLIQSILDIIKNTKREKEVKKADGEFLHIPIKVLLIIALIIIYSLLWNFIGFTLSTLLLIVAVLFVLNHSKFTLKRFIISLVFSVGMYLLFAKAFAVPIPDILMESIF